MRVHACDETPLPDVVFGTLEKVDAKYVVPIFNADLDDNDLLFCTPTLRLTKPFDTSSSSDMVLAFDPVVSDMMRHYKDRILDQARACQKEWFTKTFDVDMLPDLWKDNTKRSATIKVRPSTAADEPFAHYRPDRDLPCDEATVLEAGTEIRLLIRLESVWIGRSKFGANYVALQLLESATTTAEANDDDDASSDPTKEKEAPRRPPRTPVREKLVCS